MKKQTIVFDKPEGKKHSVCFKTSQDDPAITSVYVMRSHLGSPAPKKIKITIEEVE
jgi:hypothetical protein